MEIPFVDLKAQYQDIKNEVLEAIATALDGMNLFLGENTRALEREFARYCETSFAVGVGSGTDALYLALRACGVAPGDEVITVSHTFIATAEAIFMAGARPVFVDIEPKSYNMDPAQVKAAITPRSRAIVPVHLYGYPADMDPILDLAKEYGLKVISDACQAHGATYRGKSAGALGDAAAFSFYFSKNLGAYGEAGMVTTSDEEVASKIRVLRDHGSAEKYSHTDIGVNSRLDELQAAVLRVKLRYLDEWIARRRANAEIYNSLLPGGSVGMPDEFPGWKHAYHLYVIETDHRDALQQWLGSRGVATGIHYPVPIHEQPAMKRYGHAQGSLPITESKARRILSLPMYPELTMAQIQHVAGCVQEFYAETPAQHINA